MPTVPTYNSGEVQTTGISGGQISTAAPGLEAFGGGEAAARVGQGLQQSGEAFAKYAYQEKQKADQTRVTDAVNKTIALKNDLFWNPKTGASTRKGEQAFGAIDDYSAQYDKGTQEIEKGLNNEQKEIYRAHKDSQKNELVENLNKHVYIEGKRYENDTMVAKVNSVRDDAVMNFQIPGKVQQAVDDQIQAISEYANNNGIPQEVAQMQAHQAVSKTHEAVLGRMMSLEMDQQAEVYFNQVQDHLLPDDAIKLRKEIEISSLKGQSLRLSDQITQSSLTLGQAVKKIPRDDPKLFDATLQRVRENFQMKEIDIAQQERAQKKAEETQQKGIQNDFIKRMEDNSLTAKEIIDSPLAPVGSGSKEQFLQMLKKKQEPEERLKTDAGVFINVMERIHLPDGDPNKITNEGQITQMFGKGLSYTDMIHARDEFNGSQTEEGKQEASAKSGVIDAARSALTKTNKITGISDPIGDTQMQRFMLEFNSEYRRLREAGVPSVELLSPDSPKYLGKNIDKYRRSSRQIMKDQLNLMRAPPSTLGAPLPEATTPLYKAPMKQVVPRQPGETPADYLKRIKGGG